MTKEFEQEIQGVFNPKTDSPGIEKEIPRTNPELKKKLDQSYFNMKPNEEEQEIEWKDNSNKRLKERGSSNRVINLFWNKVIIVFLMLIIIVGVGFFSWGTYVGRYKTVVVDNSTTICEASSFECPKITIPSCPECPETSCGNTNITINPVVYANSS